jgi:hypothetical protein
VRTTDALVLGLIAFPRGSTPRPAFVPCEVLHESERHRCKQMLK